MARRRRTKAELDHVRRKGFEQVSYSWETWASIDKSRDTEIAKQAFFGGFVAALAGIDGAAKHRDDDVLNAFADGLRAAALRGAFPLSDFDPAKADWDAVGITIARMTTPPGDNA